jgi:hypothetical protein
MFLNQVMNEKRIAQEIYVNQFVGKLVSELPPHKKQACADTKRDSKMTKINVSVAHIKFSISPIVRRYF